MDAGWRPLRPPANPAERPPTTAFTRLARVHAVGAAADAMIATSLAGSLFFSIPTGEARGKVLLYLLITMAPFAVVSPLIGPLLDRLRGGRRWMVIVSAVLRATVAALMIQQVQSLWLFPLAFCMLILQKSYSVARSALVPTTVRSDEELVTANSKLALVSGVMGFAGAVPGAALMKLGGPEWSLGLASLTYMACTVVSMQLPASTVAIAPDTTRAVEELHSAQIRMASSGMGLLRGIVGFLTILLAFELRGHNRPLWEFGLVGGVSVLGSLIGAVVAPKIRRVAVEERILIGALLLTVLAAFCSAVLLDGVFAAALLGFVTGVCSSGGKLAFDSILQRDAPDANRGRSFARFEARFQVIWVVGAAIAVTKMPVEVGYVAILVVAAFAAFSYGVGLLAARQRSGAAPTTATAAAAEVEARMNEVSAQTKERVGGAARAVGRRLKRRETSPPR